MEHPWVPDGWRRMLVDCQTDAVARLTDELCLPPMLSAVCLNQKKCVPGKDLGRIRSASGKNRVNVGVPVCQSVPGCKSVIA